ncbi:MAG: iron-sulfur cluster assembly scaffold protein [Chloroflexi bacterium]|nr:MAG: iron-sulfur cluster assembly scaffold protein [Chloroflexota bacterium]
MTASHQDAIERLLDHYRRPRYYGELADALTYSGGVPDCGDTLTVYLRVASDGRLAALQFTGQGCSVSLGTASILIERLQGATLADLAALDEVTAIEVVGPDILQARPQCATLAYRVLKAAAQMAMRQA